MQWDTSAPLSEAPLFKTPAQASKGMVCTNHPIASAAGVEMFAVGGNAIDAAVASLFCLSVVEPMMVGICGGGIANIHLADGTVVSIDNYSTSPGASTPTLYTPKVVPTPPRADPSYLATVNDASSTGLLAVGVPGTLKAWCHILEHYGTLPLATVMGPAIRHATNGFGASEYLAAIIKNSAALINRFPATAAVFMPSGAPPSPGDPIVQSDLAMSYKIIAEEGPDALYGGVLGKKLVDYMATEGGLITLDDLKEYTIAERYVGPVASCPTLGTYRGFQIVGCTPCSAGGVHLVEMLNILEHFDVAALGFGTKEGIHLLTEVMKLGFEDRNTYTGDPAFLDVPVEMLVSKDYAAKRASHLSMDSVRPFRSEGPAESDESANTTNLAVADANGNVVEMTQTINGLFGCGAMVPGTGIMLNNTQNMFDPHPDMPHSVAPGKRVTSSMAPTIVLYPDGSPFFAVGLPGGIRIFTSVLQAVVNIIDHKMTPQQAVEAPRMWTQGADVLLERTFPGILSEELKAMGHSVGEKVPTIGGGMSMVMFSEPGSQSRSMTGACCWRADGTPMGMAGGYAMTGARFSTGNPDDKKEDDKELTPKL